VPSTGTALNTAINSANRTINARANEMAEQPYGSPSFLQQLRGHNRAE
jgi:hypothetical protein